MFSYYSQANRNSVSCIISSSWKTVWKLQLLFPAMWGGERQGGEYLETWQKYNKRKYKQESRNESRCPGQKKTEWHKPAKITVSKLNQIL